MYRLQSSRLQSTLIFRHSCMYELHVHMVRRQIYGSRDQKSASDVFWMQNIKVKYGLILESYKLTRLISEVRIALSSSYQPMISSLWPLSQDELIFSLRVQTTLASCQGKMCIRAFTAASVRTYDCAPQKKKER